MLNLQQAEPNDQPDDFVITQEHHAHTVALALGGLYTSIYLDLYADAKAYNGRFTATNGRFTDATAADDLRDMLDRLELLGHAGAAIDKLEIKAARSRKEIKRVEAESHLCVDCGADTLKIREHYMVEDEVWAKAAMDPSGGMLCLGCLERRIGRELCRGDFIHAPINDYCRSKRWEDRLTARERGA